VPGSLRQIFGSSESKLSKIVGHTVEEGEKHSIRSNSICSADVNMEKKKQQ
jgi:hypothetical protein